LGTFKSFLHTTAIALLHQSVAEEEEQQQQQLEQEG
jgi:hypothetical protein